MALTPGIASAKPLQKVIIAEPALNFSYLPLYVAQADGYFKQGGLTMSLETLSSSSSEFVNAVLSGAVWGFIGGPEHDAYANVKGADLKSVANIVNVSNNYLVARKGVNTSKPLKVQLKGAKIAVSAYGGTPNVDLRYWLTTSLGLTPDKDVTLVETATNAFLGAMKSGQIDYAVTTDPTLTQGIEEGLWTQPIFDFAKWFGPYTYSTINVPEKTIQEHPAEVKAFVAAIAKADNEAIHDKANALAVAKKYFPDLSSSLLNTMYIRASHDHMWAAGAKQTYAGFETDVRAITVAGTYTGPKIKPQSVIDNQFIPGG